MERFRQIKDKGSEAIPSLRDATRTAGFAYARWEKFRFNPPPSHQYLEGLVNFVGVDADRLAQMLPPTGVGMKMEPIQLCAACYAQSPLI